MNEAIHIISLGAGVQSSTMALMAAKGEITPMPECAVFADTGAEPESVYKWLAWLESTLPFPVYRVMQGNGLIPAALELRTSGKTGKTYLRTGLPVYYNHIAGIGSRQCTRDYKITPINREIKRLVVGNMAFSWIGISTDEASRMKDSRDKQIFHRWPLIEQRMSRHDCVNWMRQHGYQDPPRSACYFCPFKSDYAWRMLKRDETSEFLKAVAFEKQLQVQARLATALDGVPFLHKSCTPLANVDFSSEEERGQLNMFENECEGMCGV